MMGQIFLNHLFRQFTSRHAKIAACPKMTAPITFSYRRKFFKQLHRCSPLETLHDLCWTHRGWRLHQYRHMIFTHYTPYNLYLKLMAGLAYQFPQPKCQFATQYRIAIFRYPYKVVFQLALRMRACAIVHLLTLIQPLAESYPPGRRRFKP